MIFCVRNTVNFRIRCTVNFALCILWIFALNKMFARLYVCAIVCLCAFRICTLVSFYACMFFRICMLVHLYICVFVRLDSPITIMTCEWTTISKAGDLSTMYQASSD